jgi:hypothetical protein
VAPPTAGNNAGGIAAPVSAGDNAIHGYSRVWPLGHEAKLEREFAAGRQLLASEPASVGPLCFGASSRLPEQRST